MSGPVGPAGPGRKAPIEKKVTAASLASLAAGVAVAVLNAAVTDSEVLGALPAVAQFVVLAAAPPVLTFLGGFAAPHTARPPAPLHRPGPLDD